mmetsp:Transcript_9594/g.23374  ORF Transcript_9594/g.23374 Transcript_9594/m.23374 type:complete len:201 (+) Transcript_9594:208-810(+)
MAPPPGISAASTELKHTSPKEPATPASVVTVVLSTIRATTFMSTVPSSMTCPPRSVLPTSHASAMRCRVRTWKLTYPVYPRFETPLTRIEKCAPSLIASWRRTRICRPETLGARRRVTPLMTDATVRVLAMEKSVGTTTSNRDPTGTALVVESVKLSALASLIMSVSKMASTSVSGPAVTCRTASPASMICPSCDSVRTV